MQTMITTQCLQYAMKQIDPQDGQAVMKVLSANGGQTSLQTLLTSLPSVKGKTLATLAYVAELC